MLKDFRDFQTFVNELAVAKIHYFSNSGKTDYGTGYVVKNKRYISSELGKGDKILWCKNFTELSKEEYLEFSDMISSVYKKYAKEYINIIESEIFLSENISKPIEALPFTVTDYYDTLYFNIDEIKPDKYISQEELDKVKQQEGAEKVFSISDVISLSTTVLSYVIDILTSDNGNVRAMWM